MTQNLPPTARAYLLLVLTMLFWAGNAVAGRFAVGHLSPMALTAFRLALVVAVLAAIAREPLRREWPLVRAHAGYLVAMGSVGFVAFTGLMYWAARHTTAVNITILQGAIPVLVLAGLFALHGARIGLAQAAGIAVTLAGIALLASQGSLATLAALTFNIGDLAMLGACLLWAGYTIGLRAKPALSPLAFFASLSGGAFAASLVTLAIEAAFGATLWPATWQAVAIIVYVALFPSLIAQMTYIRAVELIGPGRAGLFLNLVPVFGATLGWGLLGERFGWVEAASLALVVGGILLAERR